MNVLLLLGSPCHPTLVGEAKLLLRTERGSLRGSHRSWAYPGSRCGVFATTEPATASDLRAIRTEAVRSGDILQLTGEKFLITNAAPGRTGCVLCRVEGELRMLVVELSDAEDDHFQRVHYGVRAFRHVAHRALVFHQLAVPADNLLDAPGLVVAYHALNHGRVAVCAGAAGLLRRMTGSLIPWVQARETFGALIGTRELVQRRPTSDYHRQITQLGGGAADDQFDLVRDAPRDRPIMAQHLLRAEHPKTTS